MQTYILTLKNDIEVLNKVYLPKDNRLMAAKYFATRKLLSLRQFLNIYTVSLCNDIKYNSIIHIDKNLCRHVYIYNKSMNKFLSTYNGTGSNKFKKSYSPFQFVKMVNCLDRKEFNIRIS